MAGYKEFESFETHLPYLESFHKRYMANNKVCSAWVNSISALSVDMIAPQHGALFREENVQKLLDRFDELECGSALIEDLY